jgi:hypothetical protein
MSTERSGAVAPGAGLATPGAGTGLSTELIVKALQSDTRGPTAMGKGCIIMLREPDRWSATPGCHLRLREPHHLSVL